MQLTPAQCRAGRALIEMSREELAMRASVAVRTISDFESARRQPINSTLAAMRRALEEAGVMLIPENGGGAGVRLRMNRQAE